MSCLVYRRICMKAMKMGALLTICVVWLGAIASAQGVGASGEITGTITDPSGAVLANAKVTASNAERGIRRSITTDDRGQYRLTGLSPAVYDVSSEASGFQNAVHKSVVVNVGQTVVLDFHVAVSQVSEQVEVNMQAPVVETERGHQEIGRASCRERV